MREVLDAVPFHALVQGRFFSGRSARTREEGHTRFHWHLIHFFGLSCLVTFGSVGLCQPTVLTSSNRSECSRDSCVSGEPAHIASRASGAQIARQSRPERPQHTAPPRRGEERETCTLAWISRLTKLLVGLAPPAIALFAASGLKLLGSLTSSSSIIFTLVTCGDARVSAYEEMRVLRPHSTHLLRPRLEGAPHQGLRSDRNTKVRHSRG